MPDDGKSHEAELGRVSGEQSETERRFARATELIARGRQALGEGHRLMRQLSGEVRAARARGAIHQHIWDCERLSGKRAQHFSASGQDAFLDEQVFAQKRGGVFVEIGAFDGITGSTCLFFEMMRGWSGILVEPATGPRAKAATFRRCPCLPVAAGASSGESGFFEILSGAVQNSGLVDTYPPELRARVEADPEHEAKTRPVRTRALGQILDSQHLRRIDLVSLDVSGAEFMVLQAFAFQGYEIEAWSINCAHRGPEILKLMQARGYRRLEALGQHDIYLRR